MSPPRRLSVHHRPDRHSSPAPETARGPCLLPVSGAWLHDRSADGWEWTLGSRARQLYLNPATLTGDLTRIGLHVPPERLAAILAGDEPAPAVILAGLVDVLELRDPTVGDHPLITAVTRSWCRAGWPVPTEILTVLATARNLSLPDVRAVTAQTTPIP